MSSQIQLQVSKNRDTKAQAHAWHKAALQQKIPTLQSCGERQSTSFTACPERERGGEEKKKNPVLSPRLS